MGNRCPTAHRVAYVLTHGEPPQGMDIAHTCHNKLCCNPAHLEAQTRSENIWANVTDKRTKRVKLTDWQVKFIWYLRMNKVRMVDIAKAVECPLSTVENVVYKAQRHSERISWT